MAAAHRKFDRYPRRLHSIKEFGFINPVLIDGSNGIIAGHGRVEAAKLVGMRDVPTVRVDHLTPAQIRAYVIADNKLAENAGWDRELLVLELKELSVELNFDVTVTGFETAEIDLLIEEFSEDTSDEADELPGIDRSIPAVTRLGDCWRLGDHLLLCGDALKVDSYDQLLGGSKAQLIFTDPPYNVAIDEQRPVHGFSGGHAWQGGSLLSRWSDSFCFQSIAKTTVLRWKALRAGRSAAICRSSICSASTCQAQAHCG